ncbi:MULTISPECIES: hypothetical protein [Candidatus Nitrosocaldus]|nr:MULTISPECIES: hypothetical protein [Candidatus Nitrosocaldus]
MYSNGTNLLSMLSMLKHKAMRSKVWYRALSIDERVLTGLATRYIRQVRNKQLAIVLARIVIKLSIAINRFIMAEQHGFARAYAWMKGALKSGMGIFMCVMGIGGNGAYLSTQTPTLLIPSKSIIEWFAMLEANLMHGWRLDY